MLKEQMWVQITHDFLQHLCTSWPGQRTPPKDVEKVGDWESAAAPSPLQCGPLESVGMPLIRWRRRMFFRWGRVIGSEDGRDSVWGRWQVVDYFRRLTHCGYSLRYHYFNPFSLSNRNRIDGWTTYMSRWVMFELEPAFALNSGATVERKNLKK